MCSRTLYAQHPVHKNLCISPRFSPTIFYRNASSVFLLAHLSLYSSIINRLYAQNPVFEIVHDESVKVYPHMYNRNVQQNPLCVESCVTKEFSISPRFSPTIFDPDANSELLRAHLCTTVDSMRQKTLGGLSLFDESIPNEDATSASRSLQEGSTKPPWGWVKPSKRLREGFSISSRSLQRLRHFHEALVKMSRTLREGATASPLHECFMKAP